MAPGSNDAATLRSAAGRHGVACVRVEEMTPPPRFTVISRRRAGPRQLVTGACRKYFDPRHTMIVPDHRDVRAP